MNKQFLFLVLALFTAFPVLGQSYYKEKSATKNGITYICEHDSDLIEIYLSSNQYHNVKMTFKDGSSISNHPTDILYSAGNIVTANNQNLDIQIIQQVLGDSMMKKFKDKRELLILSYTIGTNGNITEMSFVFGEESAFTEIAPDIFYQIEQQIKSRLKYTLKEEASEYNIIKIDAPIRFWDL